MGLAIGSAMRRGFKFPLLVKGVRARPMAGGVDSKLFHVEQMPSNCGSRFRVGQHPLDLRELESWARNS